MSDFDASLTWTSFSQHRASATSQRQQQLLQTVIDHSRAEVEANLDGVLGTLSADPQYYDFGVVVGGGDTGPKGADEVLANYEAMVSNGSYVIESRKDRVFVDDNSVITEGSFRQVLTADVARAMNHVASDAEGYFLLTGRTAVFWDFDRDGKALGERRFVVPISVEPIPESELPGNFPAHLRSGPPGAESELGGTPEEHDFAR